MSMIKQVTKRDGRVVPFTQDRITNAILEATDTFTAPVKAKPEAYADLKVEEEKDAQERLETVRPWLRKS